MKITFRRDLLPSDRDSVRAIVESAGFFSDEEVSIAVELVDERLAKGDESGYHFLMCEDDRHEVKGYTCYGPIPGTRQSFDLYWIAVRSECRGQGIGRALIRMTEDLVVEMGGARIYIETSSRDLYEPTREFYTRSGYASEAILKDFYAPGDSKLIYVKGLGHDQEG